MITIKKDNKHAIIQNHLKYRVDKIRLFYISATNYIIYLTKYI